MAMADGRCRAGLDAVRRTVEAAPQMGISVLTLFAFSADNWRRPTGEVDALMSMLGEYLEQETAECVHKRVRVEAIGRRDRLDPPLQSSIACAEGATAAGERLHLRVAIDYSARDAILAAARGLKELSLDALGKALGPPVDLLIRTGGERRLSDFLLWESAYAELVFSRTMWPDFDREDLASAVRDFRGRERRFGGVPEQAVHLREAWLD